LSPVRGSVSCSKKELLIITITLRVILLLQTSLYYIIFSQKQHLVVNQLNEIHKSHSEFTEGEASWLMVMFERFSQNSLLISKSTIQVASRNYCKRTKSINARFYYILHLFFIRTIL